MPTVRLETGISCYYEEAGAGVPLIFIAGVGADHAAWIPQVAEFSRYFRAITFDNRGIGRSDVPLHKDTYSVHAMADDTAALMEALGIEKAHVVGQSLGSVIAQELVLRHPERLLTLQLSVTWGRSDERIRNLSRVMCTLLDQGLVEEYTAYVYSLAFSPLLLETVPGLIEQLSDGNKENGTGRPTRQGLIGQWHAACSHNALDRLGDIDIPTHVIAGEGDALIHPAYAVKVAEAIRGSRFHFFRGEKASHLLHIEMARQFNMVTLEFIRNHIGF
ncbi:MAG: alpha/beta hydrolase [Candidatus Eremiobacteraeota bacterium]|nr:alpha/beta hydrolase [Candidatus Eremiobacteraeota bacterium]